MPFSFEKRHNKPALQQEMSDLRRKNVELEQKHAHLTHVNQALTDALKLKGVLVTVNGATVTFSEPEMSKPPESPLARVEGVPPRASAKKQPVVKKEATHHDKG